MVVECPGSLCFPVLDARWQFATRVRRGELGSSLSFCPRLIAVRECPATLRFRDRRHQSNNCSSETPAYCPCSIRIIHPMKFIAMIRDGNSGAIHAIT